MIKNENKEWFDELNSFIEGIKESNGFKEISAGSEGVFEKNKAEFIKIFNAFEFNDQVTDQVKGFALEVSDGAMIEFFRIGVDHGMNLICAAIKLKLDPIINGRFLRMMEKVEAIHGEA